MSSLFGTSYADRNNIWVKDAQAETRVLRKQLAQAQERIVKLEDALEKSHKDSNGVMAVLAALKAEVEQLNPNSPLLIKDNRLKIYKANYKL